MWWKELKRVHYMNEVAHFSKLVISFTPIHRRQRRMFNTIIRPIYSWRAICRTVLDKLWWRHKCQRPRQIEPLWYALIHWPTRVWACCHTKEDSDLTRVTRDNAVGIPTRLHTGQSWVRNSVEGGGLEFSSSSERPDQLWGSFGLPFKGHKGSFPRVKALWRVMSDAVHLLPLYTCMVWTRTSKFLPFFLTWPDAQWTSHFPNLVHFIL